MGMIFKFRDKGAEAPEPIKLTDEEAEAITALEAESAACDESIKAIVDKRADVMRRKQSWWDEAVAKYGLLPDTKYMVHRRTKEIRESIERYER